MMLQNKSAYLTAGIGAVCLMLLKICDAAGLLSVILVLTGLATFVYSIRHAASRKEYAAIAILMALTFTVRFYGYTGDTITDLLLGPLIGLLMFAILAAERLARKWDASFWYTLLTPSFYFLFLWFTEIVKINMPFRLDPYLSGLTVLCQVASLFGIYILDFLLSWMASVLVFVIDHRAEKVGRATAWVYVAVLGAVFLFGMFHLHRTAAAESAKTDTVRIACVTPPYCGDFTEAPLTEYTFDDMLDLLTKEVADVAQVDAEIMVTSEEAYGMTDKDEAAFLETAKDLARKNHMHLLLAYEVEDTDGSENGKDTNKLCWISDEGEILYDYTKHCLVPFIEAADYVRGEQTIEAFDITVQGKKIRVATAICYDSDFDSFMSHIGKNVDLLLLPTWDWDVVAEEHLGVARLRAIASGTTVVRCVYDGWSAVINSAGQVLALANSNEVGYGTVLVYDVPIP